jgi:MinD-like ATPase involved in chromosome partitioning or flagellar assembly
MGMTSLVLAGRQGVVESDAYTDHIQTLPGGLDVLVAPTGADSATALDRELGLSSADLIAGDCDLLADCGRLLPGATGQERVVRGADRVLLIVRPDVAGIAHAQWAGSKLRALSESRLLVVIFGVGNFKPPELAGELDTAVIGSIPFDPSAALMAGGGPGTVKEFSRSPLVASAREIVAALIQETTTDREQGQGIRGRTPDSQETARPMIRRRLRSESRVVGTVPERSRKWVRAASR